MTNEPPSAESRALSSEQLPNSPNRRALLSVLIAVILVTLLWWQFDAQPSGKNGAVIRADGAERLTDGQGPTSYQNACFAPDGSTIVYTRWRTGYNRGTADLVVRSLDDGSEHVLVGDGDSANVNVPAGCWRGDDIVFASDRGGLEADEIWLIHTDGAELRRLTHHGGELPYIEPSFSPDGQMIVFEQDRVSDENDAQLGQIFTMRRDGTQIEKLTDETATITDDRLPSFAPDGRLLFQRRILKNDAWSDWDIFVTERGSDGRWSKPVNVTRSAGQGSEETDPSWSSDGRFILTSSDRSGLPHPNIIAFPISGGEPIRLTQSPDREDGAAAMSPDGQWLAFESHRTANEDSPSDIWLKSVRFSQ